MSMEAPKPCTPAHSEDKLEPKRASEPASHESLKAKGGLWYVIHCLAHWYTCVSRTRPTHVQTLNRYYTCDIPNHTFSSF